MPTAPLPALLTALLDLALPRRCVGCSAPGALLCRRCVPDTATVRVPVRGLQVTAAVDYEDAVRVALLRYKERGRRDLVAPLGELLAGAVRTVLDGRAPPGLLLVPVPSARAAAAARGGDHVVRLARRAAVATGVRTATGVLGLARAVEDSAGLGAAERAANLAGAMRARAAPAGAVALVVDDIVTTGATLREASRALRAAGWPVLGAAAVAATPRRSGTARGASSPLAAPGRPV